MRRRCCSLKLLQFLFKFASINCEVSLPSSLSMTSHINRGRPDVWAALAAVFCPCCLFHNGIDAFFWGNNSIEYRIKSNIPLFIPQWGDLEDCSSKVDKKRGRFVEIVNAIYSRQQQTKCQKQLLSFRLLHYTVKWTLYIADKDQHVKSRENLLAEYGRRNINCRKTWIAGLNSVVA